MVCMSERRIQFRTKFLVFKNVFKNDHIYTTHLCHFKCCKYRLNGRKISKTPWGCLLLQLRLRWRYLFIDLLIHIWLLIAVCLGKRQDMSKNSNTSQLFLHFWISFWYPVLFTWYKGNIRKQNHLKKYEKVSLCSLKCGDITWYGQRRNASLENSKASLRIWPQIFQRGKI